MIIYKTLIITQYMLKNRLLAFKICKLTLIDVIIPYFNEM
jgi:hypothetical protein